MRAGQSSSRAIFLQTVHSVSTYVAVEISKFSLSKSSLTERFYG